MTQTGEIRPAVSFCMYLFGGLGLGASHGPAAKVLSASLGMKNGILYGTIGALLGKPIQILASRMLKPEIKSPTCSKIISGVISFFSSTASAWGMTNTIMKTQNEFSYPDALCLSATAVGLFALFASPCMAIGCSIKASHRAARENVHTLIPLQDPLKERLHVEILA